MDEMLKNDVPTSTSLNLLRQWEILSDTLRLDTDNGATQFLYEELKKETRQLIQTQFPQQ